MLDADERAALQALARRPTTSYQLAVQARIVLTAADCTSNTLIAADQRVHVDTVRKWRVRFYRRRLDGLADAPRPGRPRQFSDVQTAQVKPLACELPAERGVPLSRWSAADLADEAVAAGIVKDISAATVARWLAADAIKPWRHRSWIFPRDPQFAVKASTVLDLYARAFDGQPLGAGEFVISADENTSIQTRCRCHPCPCRKPHPPWWESVYEVSGILTQLFALGSQSAGDRCGMTEVAHHAGGLALPRSAAPVKSAEIRCVGLPDRHRRRSPCPTPPTPARRRTPAQANSGRQPGHHPGREDPQLRPQWTTAVRSPAGTPTMIQTRRHANALVSTDRHEPPPGQHGDNGAPTEHQAPTSWELGAHLGKQSRPQPASPLVTALIVKCARRDSNP